MMINEIIAVLIIVAAIVTIPPLLLCDPSRHFGYIECLKGWCILLVIIIGVFAAVLAIWWALFTLTGAAS